MHFCGYVFTTYAHVLTFIWSEMFQLCLCRVVFSYVYKEVNIRTGKHCKTESKQKSQKKHIKHESKHKQKHKSTSKMKAQKSPHTPKRTASIKQEHAAKMKPKINITEKAP